MDGSHHQQKIARAPQLRIQMCWIYYPSPSNFNRCPLRQKVLSKQTITKELLMYLFSRLKLNSLKIVYNITEELDLSDNGSNYDKKTASKIVIHPDFYSGGLHNDIALLILENEIELKGLVNSVCLPQQGEVFNSTNCWAAGWGDTKSTANNGKPN